MKTNSTASTPGLFIPKSVALKPYVRSRPTSNKATSKSEIAAKELLLRSEDDFKLQYTAKEEEADEVGPDAEGAESYLKHYVGVYDPDTGKLEVMEARSMVVRGTVQAHQPPAEDLVAMVSRFWSHFGTILKLYRIIENRRTHLAKPLVQRKQRRLSCQLRKTPLRRSLHEMPLSNSTHLPVPCWPICLKPRPAWPRKQNWMRQLMQISLAQ